MSAAVPTCLLQAITLWHSCSCALHAHADPLVSVVLQESQELFELYVSDYIPLQRCSEELLHLKALWDTVGAVMFTFEDWYR
jgi:hypothetical protein